MSMYVVQVKPGTDLQVAVLLRKNGHLVRCPQRTMDIRKNGKWNSITEPVFPGYLFLEEEIDRQKYDSVVQSDGVIGFLKVSGCTLGKLQPHEEAYIRWLWNGGKPIAPSRIYTTLQGGQDGLVRRAPGILEQCGAAGSPAAACPCAALHLRT